LLKIYRFVGGAVLSLIWTLGKTRTARYVVPENVLSLEWTTVLTPTNHQWRLTN
jgi:hypothetical protein